MEELVRSLRDYSLLQCLLLQGSEHLRARMDYLRHLLELPAGYRITFDDIGRFNDLVKVLTSEWQGLSREQLREAERNFVFKFNGEKYGRKDYGKINALLAEQGSDKRLFFGSRKEGQSIVLFGPVRRLTIEGRTINVLESEEVRSPAAILPMVAITSQQHEVIIRRESLEAVYWSRYADKYPQKEQFIEELIETTARHEIGHVLFSEAYADKDLLVLGKLLSAKVENSPIEILEEILVDWMPEGTFPYIARLARNDYPKAKRLFYRCLSDLEFYGTPDQRYLRNLSDLMLPLLRTFILTDEEVDFEGLLAAAPQIYGYFLDWHKNTIVGIKKMIEEATFSAEGFEVPFSLLAESQKNAFARENSLIDPDSIVYKRYFWANMLNYLKNCNLEAYASIDRFLVKFPQRMNDKYLVKNHE